MQLNYDLIRDILLAAESKGIDSSLSYKELLEFSNKTGYFIESIKYHLKKMHESEIIEYKFESFYGNEEFYLKTITFQGHQFLDIIRSDDVWKTVKSESKTKILTLDNFIQLALQVSANFVSYKLGFN